MHDVLDVALSSGGSSCGRGMEDRPPLPRIGDPELEPLQLPPFFHLSSLTPQERSTLYLYSFTLLLFVRLIV